MGGHVIIKRIRLSEAAYEGECKESLKKESRRKEREVEVLLSSTAPPRWDQKKVQAVLCPHHPSLNYWAPGGRTLSEDALQEASSNSDRTLLWRVFSWPLYFATPFSHVCTHLHTCAPTVLESVLKSRRRSSCLMVYYKHVSPSAIESHVRQRLQKVRTGCSGERRHQP